MLTTINHKRQQTTFWRADEPEHGRIVCHVHTTDKTPRNHPVSCTVTDNLTKPVTHSALALRSHTVIPAR